MSLQETELQLEKIAENLGIDVVGVILERFNDKPPLWSVWVEFPPSVCPTGKLTQRWRPVKATRADLADAVAAVGAEVEAKMNRSEDRPSGILPTVEAS